MILYYIIKKNKNKVLRKKTYHLFFQMNFTPSFNIIYDECSELYMSYRRPPTSLCRIFNHKNFSLLQSFGCSFLYLHCAQYFDSQKMNNFEKNCGSSNFILERKFLSSCYLSKNLLAGSLQHFGMMPQVAELMKLGIC